DNLELLELAEQEGDASLIAEIQTQADDLTKQVERLDFQLVLGGEHDARPALIAIHAGAGGTDSQDWAQMLMRMYLRWSERRGFHTEILDLTEGEEAGVKSVTIEVD